jgi:hypothetical protein
VADKFSKSIYRKVYTRIWADEKFLPLTDQEKLVALYCLTSAQTNRIGIYVFSCGTGFEEVGLRYDVFVKRFERVRHQMNWQYDEKTRVLYLPTWWRYNQPQNNDTVRGSLFDLYSLPKTPLIAMFGANDQYLNPMRRDAFRDAYAEFVKKRPQPEPEQLTAPEQPKALPAPKQKPEENGEKENAFAVFWEAYPKKRGKGAALKSWRKLRPNAELASEIVAAVKAQSRSSDWLKNNGQYIPYPAKWLNGECWLDEIKDAQETPDGLAQTHYTPSTVEINIGGGCVARINNVYPHVCGEDCEHLNMAKRYCDRYKEGLVAETHAFRCERCKHDEGDSK